MFKKRCTSVKGSSIFVRGSFKPKLSAISKISSIVKGNKKAQVTIFIILGLILLISAVLIFLMKKEIISFRLEQVSLTESGKVETYIMDCLEQVGNEALTLAAMQGGYVEVPNRYTEDSTWHIAYSPFLYVPLWANGLTVDKPHLDFTKMQVDEYIVENLRSCLYSDAVFQETYDLIENSGIDSDVEFKETSTRFKVKWNVLIKDKAGDLVSEVVNHEIVSRIQFKKMHDMATQIIEYEMDHLKIEDLVQDLIALEHPKLPVAGIEMSCSQKKWRVDETERTLRDILRINLRELKIKGTDFIPFPDELPYYQNHYVWDIKNPVDDLSIVFKFDDSHPFNFQVTPTRGNYMLSNQLGGNSDYLNFLCVQNWKFTYDVEFPIIVEVRDQGSGVTFQMAFSVNLIQNFPNKGARIEPRDSLFTSSSTDENYCYNSASYVPMTIVTESEISDSLSGVHVVEPLEGVNISYTCLKYKCEMGETVYDFANHGDMSLLSAKFPYCSGAIVRAKKDGYLDNWQYVVPTDGQQVDINLKPLFRFSLDDIEVIKHQFSEVDCGTEGSISDGEIDGDEFCYVIEEGKPLGAEESVMITLTNYDVNISKLDELMAEAKNSSSSDSEGSSSDSEETSSGEVEELIASELAEEILAESQFSSDDFMDADGVKTESHKSEFLYSPSLDEIFMSESFIEILSGANFRYSISINLVDEIELIGGYKGEWEVPWTYLEDSAESIKINSSDSAGSDEAISEVMVDSGINSLSGEKVVFHVIELNPNDQEEFFHFFGDLDKYSNMINSPSVSGDNN